MIVHLDGRFKQTTGGRSLKIVWQSLVSKPLGGRAQHLLCAGVCVCEREGERQREGGGG